MSQPQVFRRSAMWVAGLHSGGCSACAESVAALEAPRYTQRLRAQGITLARLPRQSDIILLSGALTAKAHASVSALLDGTPRPRALVAVGDCAINGCVFAGSPQLIAPLAQVFAVNVEIGGCPPAPQAIIEAIAQAQRLLQGDTLPTSAVTPLASDSEPPDTPDTPDTPDRASRLTARCAGAGGNWDDDEETDDDGLADETADHHLNDTNHLTGASHGTLPPSARQQEEKRP